MSFSTNSTNPLSAYNMTAGNLKNARSEELNRNTYERSSDSINSSKGNTRSLDYKCVHNKLFANPAPSNSLKSFKPSTGSNSLGNSTFSEKLKNCSIL